jgi:uncharacterized membrane protein
MVLPHDFLATMAWDVSISGVLLAVTAITLRYNSSTASFEESNRSSRLGFAAALGACGFYLFLSGITISFTWPYTLSGGAYNVLFGGISTLSGLVLLSGAIVLFFNADPKPVSYFAAIVGLYGMVDAYAIVTYALTSAPMLSALGYLSFAAPAFLSVPATHLKNKWWKRLFIIFLILFAAAWLYQAANFTIAHLNPSE